jgi:2-oxo-4-hydroxy-4-carboxy-5-ureidoimidazoline decarboxylase
LSELTVASQREQVGAGLNLLTLAEGEQMARLNASYREKFGFPFILCVRLNKLEAIREAFAKRLENDRAKEIELALKEISKIARLRLADAIS